MNSPDPDRKPIISLRHVSKTYKAGKGSVLAVDDVDLDIPAREFVSVLGPSGCGKSTLLRIIGGLHSYEGEAVEIDGVEVDGPSAKSAVVFQKNNLLPWLSVESNLRLGAKIRRVPEADIRDRVAAMIRILGLEDFAHSHPHQLSGGMQQRVSLGQALILNPEILLLDEPFGALDALTRDRLNLELLRIWEEQKQTVFLVTHSISEAVFLSDRVVVMTPRPGRIMHDVKVDLPHPRSVKETRANPRYVELVNQLSEYMGVV